MDDALLRMNSEERADTGHRTACLFACSRPLMGTWEDSQLFSGRLLQQLAPLNESLLLPPAKHAPRQINMCAAVEAHRASERSRYYDVHG